MIAPSVSVSAITEIPTTLVNTSFATKSAYQVASGTRILLIPHHLVAGREIASLLSSVPAPKRVVLLSPDHFSVGTSPFSLPAHSFTWQGRTIPNDPSGQSALKQALGAQIRENEAVFKGEHGVRGLLPFLTTAWPNAQIIPITVRNDTPEIPLIRLIDAVDANFSGEEDLIVFTIDFSHDLPEYIADQHDVLAADALSALDQEAAERVEVDSRPLFFALTTFANLPKSGVYGNVTIHARTNALSLMKAKTTELGTSHLIASFGLGDQRFRSRTVTLVHDEYRPVSSKENRFYQGFDVIATSTIPFPTNFVKITQATGTEWHVLPIKKSGTGWLPLNDQERIALPPSVVNQWTEWAKTHLTSAQEP